MNNKIKYKCPYCNSDNIIFKENKVIRVYYFCVCGNCGKTPSTIYSPCKSKSGAIKKWNKDCKTFLKKCN